MAMLSMAMLPAQAAGIDVHSNQATLYTGYMYWRLMQRSLGLL